MDKGFVLVKAKTLQKLLDNFNEVSSMCDELNIYEHDELDEELQKMKKWTSKKFGNKIEKENYE
jgi:hypothetical protein